jgi:hypothetical protein
MDGSLLGKRFAELQIVFAPASAIAAAGSMVDQVAALVQNSICDLQTSSAAYSSRP